MIEYIDNDKGQLRLVSDLSFPVWSIVHYLNRLSTTYLKLLTIHRVCESLAEGCWDNDLIVAEESADLITSGPLIHKSNVPYRTLMNKGDDYESFWKIIKSHHRPIVFRRYDSDSGFQPLIDISNDDLLISNLTVTSPPDITVTGVGSILTDLYYAGEREERRRRDHSNRQIGQAVRNIEDIASAHAMLNNPNISEGAKSYLENMLLGLVHRQDQLNQEMNLRPEPIDEHV